MTRIVHLSASLAMTLAAGAAACAQSPVGTGFAYQGRLTDNGQPANGVYDLAFRLFSSESGLFPIGSSVNLEDVEVVGGLFTVTVDFGAQFDGLEKWMAISVRPGPSSGSYTALLPRQRLSATPYAMSTRSLDLPLADSGTSNYIFAPGGLFRISQSGSDNAIMGEAAGGGSGVYGAASGDGAGVSGVQSAPTGFVSGVYGASASTNGRGVFGHNTSTGGSGAYGVYGVTDSNTAGATAVRGVNNGGGSAATYGVLGQSTSTGGYGVHGQSRTGVYGLGTSGGIDAIGVLGITSQTDGVGVNGRCGNGSVATGVFGQCSGSGWAGFFEGSIMVTGNMNAQGSKNFLIDNPENPANEYLTHACVESDEMKNIYDGVITLGPEGAASVVLPSWFDDLNADFRYQLTCIGGHAPVYVASEIQNNTFRIAGGAPGLRVSWQVTGVRIDPAALASRFEVISPKPEAERGRLLAPAAYGLDAAAYVGRFANPRPGTAAALSVER